MARPGVEAVAQGVDRGQPCIRIVVRDDVAAARLDLPAELEGVPVRIEVGGRFRIR